MNHIELLEKIERLPVNERLELVEEVLHRTRLKTPPKRSMRKPSDFKQRMRLAAKMMQKEYRQAGELTVFTQSLAGEDFRDYAHYAPR
jgi:hypothetical protein